MRTIRSKAETAYDLKSLIDGPRPRTVPAFIEERFAVRDRESRIIVPFSMRPVQRQLMDWILRNEEKYPVRLAILKGRREGLSNVLQAFNLITMMTRPGTVIRVAAHDAPTSEYLFSLMQTCWEYLIENHPGYHDLYTFAKKRDADQWIFDIGSQYSVETAGTKEVGRGTDTTVLHCSEMAFYPDPERFVRSASATVPDTPGSYIFYESTANGRNHFYDVYMMGEANNEAVRKGQEPWDNWRSLFFPWYDDSGYWRDRPLTPELPLRDEGELQRFLEEEEWLSAEIGLSDGQLAWRREKIFTGYHGDIEAFRQEYPISPAEAFSATASNAFDRRRLTQWYKTYTRRGMRPAIGFIEKSSLYGPITFHPDVQGLVRLISEPQESKSYLIAADPSWGIAGRDPCAAIVFGEFDGRLVQVAAYSGTRDQREMAHDLYDLAVYYNNAWICPERNQGRALIGFLFGELSWPNMWVGPDATRLNIPMSQQIGWMMSKNSKASCVQALAAGIRADAVEITDPETLDQMLHYVKDPRPAEPFGPDNSTIHDDLVDAVMIGYSAWLAAPPSSVDVGSSDIGPFLGLDDTDPEMDPLLA